MRQHIHIIGIGGIGASYVARYLQHNGVLVTGSDMSENSTVLELKKEGIPVAIGHSRENIPQNVNLVLISPAVLAGRPDEFLYVLEQQIPFQTWQEYLGEITAEKTTIAVCGAHGKSTTTAMVAMMLIEAGLDPTVMVGTKLAEFGGKNIRIGKSNLLVIEADEFHDNFLSYTPKYILCTSYEPDHLDYFETVERYRASFVEFFSKVEYTGGKVFVHEHDEAQNIAQEISVPVEVVTTLIDYPLEVMGEHNRQNASLVHALGVELGIDEQIVQKGLQLFRGTWRRMEKIGTLNNCPVYDDYAHHPTEVTATLAAFKEGMPDSRIVAVFQPHQFSRTYAFLDEFASSFGSADSTFIMDIYPSRDTDEDKKKVHATDLVEKVPGAMYAGELSVLTKQLQQIAQENPNSVFVFMGAGSISDYARSLI